MSKIIINKSQIFTSGENIKKMVIFIHGYGSDGSDLLSLSQEFQDILPDAIFLSPNAPFACEINPFGYQWFSLMSWDQDYMYQGILKAEVLLLEFINEQLEKYNLGWKDLILIGFSQGTMMSLHTAIRSAENLFAVIGFSGSIVKSQELLADVRNAPPICLIHGSMDNIVPVTAFHQACDDLKAKNIKFTSKEIPWLSHGINQEAIDLARDFLERL